MYKYKFKSIINIKNKGGKKLIKGVTKNVIEINNINSEYFEKAIIILKDDCSPNDDEIRRETQITIGKVPVFLKTIKTRLRIKMAVCAVAGALTAVLMCGTLLWASGL